MLYDKLAELYLLTPFSKNILQSALIFPKVRILLEILVSTYIAKLLRMLRTKPKHILKADKIGIY